MNPELERIRKAQTTAREAGRVAVCQATAERAFAVVTDWAAVDSAAVAFEARRTLRAETVRFWRLPALQAALGDPAPGSLEGVGRTTFGGPGGVWLVFDGSGAIVTRGNQL